MRKIQHWSDCATHSEDEPGACDCGAAIAARRWSSFVSHYAHIRVAHLGMWLIALGERLYSRAGRAANLACPPASPSIAKH